MRSACVLVLAATAGCTFPGRSGLPQPQAPWRPFLFAHVVLANDPGGPEVMREFERKAVRALGSERYLDFVEFGGHGLLVTPTDGYTALGLSVPWSCDRLRMLHGPQVRSTAPLRRVRVLTFRIGMSPRDERSPSVALREELAGTHGEFILARCEGRLAGTILDSLGGKPLRFQGIGPVPEILEEILKDVPSLPEAPEPGYEPLIYEMEASSRLRVVLLPSVEALATRRGGLVYLATPSITAGKLRLVQVEGYRLKTWLRSIETGEDEPAVEFPLRGP